MTEDTGADDPRGDDPSPPLAGLARGICGAIGLAAIVAGTVAVFRALLTLMWAG